MGLVGCVGLVVVAFAIPVFADESGTLVTAYDRGKKTVFISHEKTIGAALEAQGIHLEAHDISEPSVTEEMVASDYRVTVYRARPVTVTDGAVQRQILTPYQSTLHILKTASIEIYPEDIVTTERTDGFGVEAPGLRLNIERAKDFTFDLYGRKSVARTHALTIGEMLKEKKIELGALDRVSLPPETLVVRGMEVRVWREGKQTLSGEERVQFGREFVYDADRPLGYRAVETAGVYGVYEVTYETEIKDGKEMYKKEIARLLVKQPSPEKLVIGIKGLENGLSRSRGALHSTDSKGVVHRETYYDLDMGVVMGSCGQGGRYTVRFDGMKIDSEGYILIAANYAKYPKCSIVETSAGPGRVYDTGGFVLRHPDGFDLATDWTNNNGR